MICFVIYEGKYLCPFKSLIMILGDFFVTWLREAKMKRIQTDPGLKNCWNLPDILEQETKETLLVFPHLPTTKFITL